MITVKIKGTGFKEGAALFTKNGRRYRALVGRALKGYGDEAVGWLKEKAYAGAFGPPKRRGKGPPLIKTRVYIESIKAKLRSMGFEITPTGPNVRMSNEALGDLLEHGYGDIPARPHWRPFSEYVKRTAAKRIGDRLTNELFGRS